MTTIEQVGFYGTMFINSIIDISKEYWYISIPIYLVLIYIIFKISINIIE